MMKNDNKIKLVDLTKYGFVTEPRYYFYGWTDSPKILTRPSLVELLLKAKTYLPKGYNFKIWDGQRSIEVQIKMIENFRRRVRHANSELKKSEIERIVDSFCAKPLKVVERLDTHRHGGALDLTIVNKFGEELLMGTEFDDYTDKAALEYFENKKKILPTDELVIKNRRLLKKAMLSAGFVQHPREWWHWSSAK